MKNLKPITRREMFMAKAAGQDVTPPEPITREEMFLSDIAEHEEGQGGGGGLPAVTTTDNGNVLTVVEGVWAKASPSGGGGTMYVNLHYEEVEGEGVYTADKTVAEIVDAIETGNNVVLKEAEDGYAYFYGLHSYEETSVIFKTLYISGSFVHESKFTLFDTGDVEFKESIVTGTGG